MATPLEVLADEGIREDRFFGTTNEDEAMDVLYPMAEELRLQYLA